VPGVAWAFAGFVTLVSLVASVAHNIAPDRSVPVAEHVNSATDAHHASDGQADALLN
jgi:hypothetical protein